jgi:hypothetical protein
MQFNNGDCNKYSETNLFKIHGFENRGEYGLSKNFPA